VSEHGSEGSNKAEAVKQPKPSRLVHFRRVLREALTWQGVGTAIKACLAGASRVGWAILGIAILVVFAQSIITEIVNVEPISVPKRFAEDGYSSDVASERVRDALARFAKQTGSSMQSPHVALTSELPKITVPKVDISLDTATALVRNLLHLGNTRNISGEFVLEKDVVWLRLRIDGQEIFTGTTAGYDLEKLDNLLDAAAPSILEEIRPYLIASATYKADPDRALQMAQGIIARLPASDINVQWSYVLEGKYYLDRHDATSAESCLRQALHSNSKNAAAHYSLAVALENEGRIADAIAEYHRAIDIQPSTAVAHNNLGVLLKKQGNIDAALTEYRLAIAWDPLYAAAFSNIGAALKEQKKIPEAIAVYRRAIEIDPGYAAAHYNLAVTLRDLGNGEEAIAEFRRAVQYSPKDVLSHIGLARTLLDAKKVDEALKEYEVVVAIDPNNEIAHRNIDYLGANASGENAKQEDHP
jgi:tetratricopeptide (TPR) repeat protein